MIKWLLNLWERFHPYRTEWVEDLPSDIEPKTVYVVGGRVHPFYVAIVCPRRTCRQIIHLDISPVAAVRWCLTEHSNGRISLSPSIFVTGLSCQCHYWLREGRIVWSEAPSLLVPESNRHDP